LIVKRVTNAGTIRFKTRLLYLSTALRQHRVGLEEVDDGSGRSISATSYWAGLMNDRR
jgi:hypothetical protein